MEYDSGPCMQSDLEAGLAAQFERRRKYREDLYPRLAKKGPEFAYKFYERYAWHKEPILKNGFSFSALKDTLNGFDLPAFKATLADGFRYFVICDYRRDNVEVAKRVMAEASQSF